MAFESLKSAAGIFIASPVTIYMEYIKPLELLSQQTQEQLVSESTSALLNASVQYVQNFTNATCGLSQAPSYLHSIANETAVLVEPTIEVMEDILSDNTPLYVPMGLMVVIALGCLVEPLMSLFRKKELAPATQRDMDELTIDLFENDNVPSADTNNGFDEPLKNEASKPGEYGMGAILADNDESSTPQLTPELMQSLMHVTRTLKTNNAVVCASSSDMVRNNAGNAPIFSEAHLKYMFTRYCAANKEARAAGETQVKFGDVSLPLFDSKMLQTPVAPVISQSMRKTLEALVESGKSAAEIRQSFGISQ